MIKMRNPERGRYRVFVLKYRCHNSGVQSSGDLVHTLRGLGACLWPEDKPQRLETMTTSVTRRTAAVKRTAPRKTVVGKKVVGPAKIVEKKVAAAPKRKTSPKRIAPPAIRPEERHHLIEIAAYYIAERRGFYGASPHDDWLQAEREVDAMIKAGKFAA